jgi:hypothetical protein
MVTAPEDNRNFFILKPLLDEVVKELAMCPQMKLFWLCPQTKLPVNEMYLYFRRVV